MPPTTPTIHDKIIEAMLSVLLPLNGELRLLARLNDDSINNQSTREAFFFIPDLHLISPKRQQAFAGYGFNHADKKVLVRLLQAMATLKNSLAQNDACNLITVQAGDFFDMWRENPGSLGLSAISDETHGELRDILYRGVDRGTPCLEATMLLGNHDTDNGRPLAEINFVLKAFNRTQNQQPFLFATHGDAFDMLEIMVLDPVQEVAVQFVGKLTPVHNYWVGDWGKAASKINKPLKDMTNAITESNHALDMQTGGAIKVPSSKTLPDRLCHRIISPDQSDNDFFGKIYKSIGIAEQAGLPGRHVRVVTIGHTHRTSMLFCEPSDGGRPMLLMDVGAWIENCSYPLDETGEVVTEASAQLGVIHGNDARIYQVRVPA